MNVPQEELNRWAQRLSEVNGLLLTGINGGSVESFTAQRKLNGVFQGILRAGADDPHFAGQPKEFRPRETPLELLDTPATRRYIAALQAAVAAGREMDDERDTDGAYSEPLEDMLAGVEFETFGPVGLVRE